jgi:uncharacterized membrane protein
MEIDWAMLVSRWLHILSGMALVGGTVFMRFALHPALAGESAEVKGRLSQSVRQSWSRWVYVGIGIILATGCYNFYLRLSVVAPMPYHAIFGLKFLFALVIFFFASALVGRSSGLQAIRDRPVFYLNLNIVLAVLIVLMSGVMRVAPPKKPKEASAQSPSALVLPVATSNSANIGTSIAMTAKP